MLKKKGYPFNKMKDRTSDPNPMEDVYAGPEPDEEPTDEPTAEAPAEDKPQPPEDYPDPRLFTMVYAGPDFFGKREALSGFAFVNAESKVFCPECGTPCEKTDNFCMNCGKKLHE